MVNCVIDNFQLTLVTFNLPLSITFKKRQYC